MNLSLIHILGLDGEEQGLLVPAAAVLELERGGVGVGGRDQKAALRLRRAEKGDQGRTVPDHKVALSGLQGPGPGLVQSGKAGLFQLRRGQPDRLISRRRRVQFFYDLTAKTPGGPAASGRRRMKCGSPSGGL